MQKIKVLIIDMQKDFIEGGSLPVTGAQKDAERAAKLIEKFGGDIYDILLTYDSHHKYHIAHPLYIIDKDGKHPAGYTPIPYDSVCGKNPIYRATNPRHQQILVDYITALENGKRYPHTIWPEHCIIGTEGQCLSPILNEAILKWEETYCCVANKITKGSYLHAEHFSALRAEVIDPKVPETGINMNMVDFVNDADQVIAMGEALDFCYANTIRDLISYVGIDLAKKITICEDASSGVNPMGSTKLRDEFLDYAHSSGMQFSTTDKVLK